MQIREFHIVAENTKLYYHIDMNGNNIKNNSNSQNTPPPKKKGIPHIGLSYLNNFPSDFTKKMNSVDIVMEKHTSIHKPSDSTDNRN